MVGVQVLTMALRDDDQIPIERYRLGKLRSYEVLINDFTRIQDVATTIGTDLAFAFAFIPLAIALTITLKTVSIPDSNVKTPFLCLMFISYIAGAYFAVRAYRQRGHLKKFMQAIRDTQVAPLGEKGSELGPSELQTLPSEEESGQGEAK
jgi:hypothetical protein